MDHSSITIDGYSTGMRIPHGALRTCPISTWDQVRLVLDGFDIDQPKRDKEEIAKLQDLLKTINEENELLHTIIKSGKSLGEIK